MNYAKHACRSFLLALLMLAGCGEERVRPREEIFQDRLRIDTLYLTEDGQRVVAPGNSGTAVVDGKTGQLAYRAWQCNNPKCPGRGQNGAPHIFPWPDPFAYEKDDGTVGVRQPMTDEDHEKMNDFGEQKCPQCLRQRELAKETPAERQQYKDWCRPHVLPAAAKKLEQLDEEYRLLLERQAKRRQSREG